MSPPFKPQFNFYKYCELNYFSLAVQSIQYFASPYIFLIFKLSLRFFCNVVHVRLQLKNIFDPLVHISENINCEIKAHH